MGATGDALLEFRVLGTFEATAHGRLIPIGSPKQRALLAMLVLELNRVVSLDAIVDELWGSRPLANPNASVQSLVSRLRHSLSGACPAAEVRLVGREPGYLLEADRLQVDANRFEAAVDSGREAFQRGDARTAALVLEDALRLWRGPALADMADRRFARLEAARLDDARLAAEEELIEAELAVGRPERALARLERHVGENPLRERAWGQLMVALYRLGRQGDALRAYQEVRKVLREELGLEPTPWLRELEDHILQQRPELDGLPQRLPGVVGTPGPHARPADDTAVFLFTDIEASTRRWEGDQEAMSQDLTRHDELLRQAVEEGGGRVFSHTGDGLCAAFATARGALAAAVAGQRSLCGQPWASAAPLRVRMAIHAGAAEQRDGNYVGQALNRTARLLTLGHGGQVLCSHVVADLVRDHLPPDVSLTPLGEQQLADLTRPESVFQVCSADLPSTFPPLRSPRSRRHNLPGALTSFVGRTRELDEVRGLIRSARLVTLTGVGGVGKTRLAVEAITKLLDEFADGAWLVELGPVNEPGLVAPTLMAALGLTSAGTPAGSGSVSDRLCEHLEDRRVLLLFDNCEHLLDATAELIHLLLSRCPAVAVAATSRELFGLPGEIAWRVPPLSVPSPEISGLADLAGSDAVTLFCERARAAQPGFDLSAANAVAVAQICRRLDGIPLALELAAARIRVLGAQQIAERLDDRFRLLKGGARSSVPRHQTLRATVDWSHDLLPAPERTALRRLSVFPGSFDLEAAEAVVGDDAGGGTAVGFDVLDLVSRLVDKSLIGVEGGSVDVRYRLLETVREYGGEKLAEAGETEAIQQRHRDFFLSLAARYPFDECVNHTTVALRVAAVNHDNFRSALDWSLDRRQSDAALRLADFLWPYWLFTRPEEGLAWMAKALAAAGDVVTPARVDALIGQAMLLQTLGATELGQIEQSLENARAMAVRTQFAYRAHLAEYFLGELALIRGDREAADTLLGQALAGLGNARFPVGAAWTHHCLGWLAMADGELARAEAHFRRTAALVGAFEWDERIRIHALAGLAVVAAASGRHDQARSLAAEAVSLARVSPARPTLAMALVRAGEVAVLSGESLRGVVPDLIGFLDQFGRSSWTADAFEMAALLHESEGRSTVAARLLGASRALREASGGRLEGNATLATRLQACREHLEKELGAAALVDHETHGAAMSVRDALGYALEQLGS